MPKLDKKQKIKPRSQIMKEQRERKKALGLVGFRRDVTPEHRDKLDIYLTRLLKQEAKKNKDK